MSQSNFPPRYGRSGGSQQNNDGNAKPPQPYNRATTTTQGQQQPPYTHNGPALDAYNNSFLEPVPDYTTPTPVTSRSDDRSGRSGVPNMFSPAQHHQTSTALPRGLPSTPRNIPNQTFNCPKEFQHNPMGYAANYLHFNNQVSQGDLGIAGPSVGHGQYAPVNQLTHPDAAFAANRNAFSALGALGGHDALGDQGAFGGQDGFDGQNELASSSGRPAQDVLLGRGISPFKHDSMDDVQATHIDDNSQGFFDTNNDEHAQIKGKLTRSKQKAKAKLTTEAAASQLWAPSISNMNDVQEHLSGKRDKFLVITVAGDDFDAVKNSDALKRQHAVTVLSAIFTKPEHPPAGISIDEKASWWNKQETALERCQKKGVSERDWQNACAFSMRIVGEAIKLHDEGLSLAFLHEASLGMVSEDGTVSATKKGVLKTKSNYAIDRNIKFSGRLNAVVMAARNSKQVALDILRGEMSHMEDLVRAPTAYAAQKSSYFKVNTMRKKQLDDGKKYRDEKSKEASQPPHPAQPVQPAADGSDDMDRNDNDGEPTTYSDEDDEDETK